MVSREEREDLRQICMGMPANRVKTITFRLLDALDAAEANRARAEDCGQDVVCMVSPGCQRHWEERNRELLAELVAMTARAEKAEADAAAMREALYNLAIITNVEDAAAKKDADARLLAVKAVVRIALSSDAGATLLAELEAAKERAAKAEADAAAIVGMDSPWPLRDVLVNLAKAVDHLLHDHACDAHGYESVVAARAEVARYAGMIDLAGDARVKP